MIIDYINDAVGKYFQDENLELIKKDKGLIIAKSIKKRCNELKAAENFSIYLSTGLGKPHRLQHDFEGSYGISVTGNLRLIVRPVFEDNSEESLVKCKRIVIEGVVDYHGKKNEWIIP